MTIVVVGPTAVGKTSLAVALAHRLAASGRPAEIVNADSMLVYRGMDIGTAKPTVAEREGIRHHLVDILPVTATATVAQFQTLARDAIADCRARSVVPILVGGSALYVRAIVDDFVFPGTDPEVRARWEAELSALGPQRLHALLTERDPAAAATIEPANGRRIVRALEVGELTGEPYTPQLPGKDYLLPDVVQIGLELDRPTLDERIAQRVDTMWADGFVDEVRQLVRVGLRDGVTASRALGYRQILQLLDGEVSAQQARDATMYGTRRFVRRQDSWFRKDDRISWLLSQSPDLVETAYALAAEAPEGPRRLVKD